MENYSERKSNVVAVFYNALDESRKLIADISSNNRIELRANGVTFSMIDPFGDEIELSDVISVENGVIELENGTEADVNDFSNLTDLIGLIEVIEE